MSTSITEHLCKMFTSIYKDIPIDPDTVTALSKASIGRCAVWFKVGSEYNRIMIHDEIVTGQVFGIAFLRVNSSRTTAFSVRTDGTIENVNCFYRTNQCTCTPRISDDHDVILSQYPDAKKCIMELMRNKPGYDKSIIYRNQLKAFNEEHY